MKIKKLTAEQFNAVDKVFQALIKAEYHCNRLLEYYGDKEQHLSSLMRCRHDVVNAWDDLKIVLDAGKKEQKTNQ